LCLPLSFWDSIQFIWAPCHSWSLLKSVCNRQFSTVITGMVVSPCLLSKFPSDQGRPIRKGTFHLLMYKVYRDSVSRSPLAWILDTSLHFGPRLSHSLEWQEEGTTTSVSQIPWWQEYSD
jgi:hypothetical protein